MTTDRARLRLARKQQRFDLVMAQHSGDPQKYVLVACKHAVKNWNHPPFNGVWPKDWYHWQLALDKIFGPNHPYRLADL